MDSINPSYDGVASHYQVNQANDIIHPNRRLGLITPKALGRVIMGVRWPQEIPSDGPLVPAFIKPTTNQTDVEERNLSRLCV